VKTLRLAEVKVICWKIINTETGDEMNTLYEIYESRRKHDKGWKVVPDKLEKDKVNRRVKRVIIIISSLGILHEKVLSGMKKLLRYGKTETRTSRQQQSYSSC
jgi:hypothetical protein